MKEQNKVIMEALANELDRYMDEGWKEFIKEIKAKHDISNKRMLKILAEIKGDGFVQDLESMMKLNKGKTSLLYLTKNPVGFMLKDNRFKNIPKMCVSQKANETGVLGTMSIQINDKYWITFHY